MRALENIRPLGGDANVTLPAMMDVLCSDFADRTAFASLDETVTYRAFGARCNQYARWAAAAGIRPGDVVCLLMPNCVDYPAVWLGVTRMGGVVALLNTNLTGEALAHSVAVAAPSHLIAASALAPSVEAIGARLPAACGLWTAGGPREPGRGWTVLDREDYPGSPLDPGHAPAVSNRDTALLIYTSGTTGLPKAARISHARIMEWGLWFAGMMDVGPGDRLYDCLPMYHSTGGVVAVAAMLVRGGALVIRERFAASQFWPDVADRDCTLFLYIGELCRYLLAAPEHPRERDHRLRLCVGNGLRGEVWEAFVARFRVPAILEFYASTEGNVSLYNCEGKPGAIGRVPSFLAHRFPVALIAVDADGGQVRRGQDGLCVPCPADEIGEAVGRIADHDRHGTSAFEGYTDAAATHAKVLHDVFAPGDRWFRTGDLMRRDAAGFFYFVDRVGDTFRWKGENVSTTEVSGAASGCPGVTEALAYGVSVPGAEGRAGMLAITTGPGFSLAMLHAHLARALPEYARPLFLRHCRALETTATHKPVKAALIRDGFDPGRVDDPIYLSDRASKAFVVLDEAVHERLLRREIRV